MNLMGRPNYKYEKKNFIHILQRYLRITRVFEEVR